VIEIELKLPSGLQISFKGDLNEFAEFRDFVSGLPGLHAGGPPLTPLSPNGGDESLAELPVGDDADPLDPHVLQAHLDRIGATTDIETVTVLAHAAVQARLEGLDYTTVDRLYQELGRPRPPRWAKTFSNAKQKNFIRNVGRGLWVPTVPGDNYARYGKDAVRRSSPRRALATGQDELPPPNGGNGETS
jgi:hypothetical protein